MYRNSSGPALLRPRARQMEKDCTPFGQAQEEGPVSRQTNPESMEGSVPAEKLPAYFRVPATRDSLSVLERKTARPADLRSKYWNSSAQARRDSMCMAGEAQKACLQRRVEFRLPKRISPGRDHSHCPADSG